MKKLIPLVAILVISVLVLLSEVKKEPAAVAVTQGERFWSWEPELNAHAYLVKIVGEERLLMQQRTQKRLAPASLTKLMTAAVASRLIPATAKISLDERARMPREEGEKLSGIRVDEEFNLQGALSLLLVGSSNDVARALAFAGGGPSPAEALARGGGEKFIELMNERARILAFGNSHFSNPEGLDAEEHFTSAEDLALLAEFLWYNYPEIWSITRNIEARVTAASGRTYVVQNTNELLKEFPAILGGKTGFTDKARGNLILLYPVKPDRVAIIVLLRSENRFGDGRKIIGWLEDIWTL